MRLRQWKWPSLFSCKDLALLLSFAPCEHHLGIDQRVHILCTAHKDVLRHNVYKLLRSLYTGKRQVRLGR